MSDFFSSMFNEMGARRKRLRGPLGDRGQGLVEFAVLAGLLIGSLGLFVREWMPGAAPWGFAMPFVFVIGYMLIEFRRQASVAGGGDIARVSQQYDWIVLLWSFGCALVGVAAFVIAWGAAPPPPPPEFWTPPDEAVPIEIQP